RRGRRKATLRKAHHRERRWPQARIGDPVGIAARGSWRRVARQRLRPPHRYSRRREKDRRAVGHRIARQDSGRARGRAGLGRARTRQPRRGRRERARQLGLPPGARSKVGAARLAAAPRFGLRPPLFRLHEGHRLARQGREKIGIRAWRLPCSFAAWYFLSLVSAPFTLTRLPFSSRWKTARNRLR